MSMLRNLPFSGEYPISQHFGESPELFRNVSFKGVPLYGHPGLDFDLPPGTPVLAVQHGVVLDVRNDPDGYGQSVLLSHRWGQTFYAHLDEVRVEKGQQAAAGQTIGLSGNSGITEHPILHFGLRLVPYSIDDGWCGFTDPVPYLARLTQPRGAIIGPHIIGSIRPHLEVLSRWRPRMITLLDPSPDDLLALRDVCPDSTIVARIFVPDHEMSERIRQDPVEAAQWAHEITQTRMAYGVDYWQVANEVHQDSTGLGMLNEFELTRMALADEAGYRCAILAFSVGNPDLPENDRMAVWRHVYPALAHAEANGHVVALHQYGMPDLWGPNNAYDWYIYRLEHQVLRRLPFRRLKFAVTEYGIDGLIRGAEPSGWQNFTTPEGYVEQLLKCGRYLERFSGQVLGYTIFTLGHYNPWQSYDIIGKAAAYLADLSEKGTWREIDAQVYDIVPRDTDNSVEPGPTIIAALVTKSEEEFPAPEPIGEPGFEQESGLDDAEDAPGFEAESAKAESPMPESSRPKGRRGRKSSTPSTEDAAESVEGLDAAEPEETEPEAEATVEPASTQATENDLSKTPDFEETTETVEVVMPPVATAVEPPTETAILDSMKPDTTLQEDAEKDTEQAADQESIDMLTSMIAAMREGTTEDRPEEPETRHEVEMSAAANADEEPAPSGPLVEQRIALPFAAYNMAIKSIQDRPDGPLEGQGPLASDPSDADEVVYLVKDIFMTYYGSWEPSGEYESVPEWARDDYLRPTFLEAGADHHLFAAVIGLDGQMRKGHEIIFWSDGYERLEDPSYTDYTREQTKESSGWANLFMASGSSYVPERGDSGPWCWAPAGAAEVVLGGGLPVGHPVSTFVVWQAVPRAQWEATLPQQPGTEPEPAPPSGEEPEPAPPDEGTTPPQPSVEVERRVSEWIPHYNVTIKPLAARPDRPQGDVVYVVKDLFTTRNGSWEPETLPGSIPQWARDEYLKPFNAPDYFDDAGGDHHLFAAVIGLDGKLIRSQEIIFWSDGFEMLEDPEYDNYVHRQTKEKSGWANIITGPGSSFVPERNESGPWCWAPAGAAEVVCGGGLPANNHISFFVVWQAVPAGDVKLPDDDQDSWTDNTYLPTIPKAAPSATGEHAPGLEAGSLWVHMFRQAAWNRLGLELPVDSVIAIYARRQQLGRPVTQEFELNGHRVQGYHGGIVIMPIGQTERISHVPW
ncbi:MAG: peptidoglycan DD-metalloendopeptidase family protein [Caldilineaceae bacterium]|nr:peptidoglycan DD-metalloendopeptidase family protein [Caldilineaceae bacterium]